MIDEAAVAAASPFPAALIERWIGRAPGSWSADDLLAFARAHGIRLVSLMHAGGDGLIKTLDFVPRDESHFLAILKGGERADGSSLFPGIPTEASDVVLLPQLETAFVDPFSPRPTLAILCGHLGADRRPLPTSPDTILRRAHSRVLTETGIDLYALGEVEFFLGRRAGEGICGVDASSTGDARRAAEGCIAGDCESRSDDRNYHAASPFAFGEELRRLALFHLGEMGIPVKYGHSEVGSVRIDESDPAVGTLPGTLPGPKSGSGADGRHDRGPAMEWEQHEVELALLPVPAAANAVMLTAWVLRNLAKRLGMNVSFDPVLREGHPGNGLHFHLSPRIAGRHADVITAGGDLTEPARWLIGGLVRMGGALMAFGNRGPGSFTRLNQGREAPTAVTWGHRDRKALIRIPIVAQDSNDHRTAPPTVEFRLPDGSAHQHLLLAGIAQALLVGRETADLSALLDVTSARAMARNGNEHGNGSASMPTSPAEVARALETHRAALQAADVFPGAVIDSTIAALRKQQS